MYTKEHSSYLRILEKGEEFEECIRVSALDVTVECAVDVVVGATTSHEHGSEHQICGQRG
jgi:hypothetical protein